MANRYLIFIVIVLFNIENSERLGFEIKNRVMTTNKCCMAVRIIFLQVLTQETNDTDQKAFHSEQMHPLASHSVSFLIL